jgi:hypothetical protein
MKRRKQNWRNWTVGYAIGLGTVSGIIGKSLNGKGKT